MTAASSIGQGAVPVGSSGSRRIVMSDTIQVNAGLLSHQQAMDLSSARQM
ncbi:hypothetical protein [Streptomyces europaeiscabiei]